MELALLEGDCENTQGKAFRCNLGADGVGLYPNVILPQRHSSFPVRLYSGVVKRRLASGRLK